MNVEILYDISKNNSAVNSIVEGQSILNDGRFISIPYSTSYLPAVGCQVSSIFQNLSAECKESASGVKTGCWQILDRINLYLYGVYLNLSSINYILSSFANDVDKVNQTFIELSSAPTKIVQPTMSFGLNDEEEYSTATFNTLSSFYQQATDNILSDEIVIDRGRYNLNILSSKIFSDAHYRQLFFDQNINILMNTNVGNRNNLEIQHECKARVDDGVICTSIISLIDIKVLLNIFIQRLKNIKKISILVFHKSSQLQTKMFAYGKSTTTIANIEDRRAAQKQGKRISIVISPYMNAAMPNADKLFSVLDHIQANKLALYDAINDGKKYSVVNLDGIVYDVSSGASTPQIIPLTPEKSNGIFAYELKTTKFDNFNLTLAEVEKMFSLKKGEIISRKQLLSAIDYIFIYWLNNMSAIEYKIQTCHMNCHTNSVTSKYSFESTEFDSKLITAEVYLHVTGGCGCSILRTGSVNFKNLIPAHLRSTATLEYNSTPQNIYASVDIGGYLNNIGHSPAYCGITGGSGGGPYMLSRAGGGISRMSKTRTTIQINNSSYTVSMSATESTHKCPDENYFCIAVKVYAYYYIISKTVIE